MHSFNTPAGCSAVRLGVVAGALLISTAAFAQTRSYGDLGKPPTQEELAWSTSVDSQGKGLPPGKGTPKEGTEIFARRCASCHGPAAQGGPSAPALVGGKGTISSLQPVRTVGSYWPFATTVWDYIKRAMPPGQGGSLEANEVYALTAFVLFRNDLIPENTELDAHNLPQVRMPARDTFVPQRVEDIPAFLHRCRNGHCP